MNATQEKIIAGIKDFLIRHGHSSLTVRALAKEIDVNHGLIHHYFGSKEKMLLALIDVENQKLADAFESFKKSDASPEEAKEFVLNNVLLNQERGKLLVEFIQIGQSIPSIRDKVREISGQRREDLGILLGLHNPLDMVALQAGIIGLLFLKSAIPEIPVSEGFKQLISRFGIQPPK